MTETGEDYLAPHAVSRVPRSCVDGRINLTLPVIDRDGSSAFLTPQSEDAANNA